MKLTNRELIRLKKEVFLLEHGFYNSELFNFSIDIKHNEDKRKELMCKYPNANYYVHEELKRIWFRERFPEFFEEEMQR